MAMTSSGIWVPGTDNARGGMENHFLRFPFARDFLPGGPQFDHPNLQGLNHDLQALNARAGRQTLFAVWHDEKAGSWDSRGDFGVQIWVTRDDSWKTHPMDAVAWKLGNVASEAVPGGKIVGKNYEYTRKRGLPDREKIFQWLMAINSLESPLRDAAENFYLRSQEEHRKRREYEADQMIEQAGEAAYAMLTKDSPSRPDRTIPVATEKRKRGKTDSN